MNQEDLFKEDTSAWQGGSRTSFFSTKQWTLGLDKIILLMIVTLVFFVLSYSFGYERGRHAMDQKMRELTKQIQMLPTLTELQTQSRTKAPDASESIAPDITASTDPAEASFSAAAIEAQNGKYTIQLATVLQKDQAEDQLKALEKKGVKGFVLVRGKYYEICTGSFGTVSSAKGLLNQIHSEGRFRDAFIRPLPQA